MAERPSPSDASRLCAKRRQALLHVLSILLIAVFLTAMLYSTGWIQNVDKSWKAHISAIKSPLAETEKNLNGIQPDGESIVPGTLVYLVTGTGATTNEWVNKSRLEGVSLIYLSWKENVTQRNRANLPRNFHLSYFPNSTWTTCRNRLVILGHKLEKEQNWKFEYFVFFDEDVTLSYRMKQSPGRVIVPNASLDDAFDRFNRILLRDRPLRAGLAFNEFPNPSYPMVSWNAGNFDCIRRCQADNVVLALHRTGLAILEPYSSHFDRSTWWLSAYMANLYVSVLASEFCNYYREVLVELSTQVHGYYPRAASWPEGLLFVNNCLAKHSYSDFQTSQDAKQVYMKFETNLDRVPTGKEPACLNYPTGINFSQILSNRLKNWPTACG